MTWKDFPEIAERYSESRLPNGLTVRVVERPGFARKYAVLAAKYGSIDTAFTHGRMHFQTPPGVAHYLEHKLFDMDGESAMDLFAAVGGNPNAFTSYDMTAYYVECTDRFEENLKILLRLVTEPYFTRESVEKERGIIAQEIRMYEDSAESRITENLFAAMYPTHPVRVPIAGTVSSIAAITEQTLFDCHRAFYTPENMILCVVGDIEVARVEALARQLVKVSDGAELLRETFESDEPIAGAPKHTVANMEVSMPMFMVGFQCPVLQSGLERFRMELLSDLAVEVLMGESSPLYSRLYEEGLIDGDFSAGYESVRGVSLIIAGGDSPNPDAVFHEIVREASCLVREGIEPERFDRLKKSEIGRKTRELDSFEAVAYKLCACFFEEAEYYEFPDVYRGITAADVRELIRTCIVPERAVISIINPKEEE